MCLHNQACIMSSIYVIITVDFLHETAYNEQWHQVAVRLEKIEQDASRKNVYKIINWFSPLIFLLSVPLSILRSILSFLLPISSPYTDTHSRWIQFEWHTERENVHKRRILSCSKSWINIKIKSFSSPFFAVSSSLPPTSSRFYLFYTIFPH